MVLVCAAYTVCCIPSSNPFVVRLLWATEHCPSSLFAERHCLHPLPCCCLLPSLQATASCKKHSNSVQQQWRRQRPMTAAAYAAMTACLLSAVNPTLLKLQRP